MIANAVTIVILQDGETYSMLNDCTLCVTTEDELDALQEGRISIDELQILTEITLKGD